MDPEEQDMTTAKSENPEKAIDDELALIENAFEYLTKKNYPLNAAKIIRDHSENSRET